MATLTDVSWQTMRLPFAAVLPELPDDGSPRDADLLVRVVDEDGGPAADVAVHVITRRGDKSFLAADVVTDKSGRSRIVRLPRGEAWVIVEQTGRARMSTHLVLDAGERTVDLALAPAREFEVVVVDPGQRPVFGAAVTIYGLDPLPHRAFTDRDGVARFDSLGPGPYSLDVTATGFDPKIIEHTTGPQSPLFVRLEKLGGLEVSVRLPDGTPAGGATVWVAGSALWPARTAITDSLGQVLISGLPRGFYHLRAERDNLVSRENAGILLDRGERQAIDVLLAPGRRIAVNVTDGPGDDAEGVPGADVAVVEDGLSSFPRYGRTDKSGHVTIGPVASRGVSVSARASGFVSRRSLMLDGDATEARIILLKGGTVIGSIVDARDRPIAGAQLEVVGVDIDGMPIVESSNLTQFRDDHFEFALPGATPLIPAGELGVMPIIPDIPRSLGALHVTRGKRTASAWVSTEEGRFSLNPVTPGEVRVIARHPEFVTSMSKKFQLGPGGQAEVTIVMMRGGVLEGRILESDRRPVSAARIEVVGANGGEPRITYTAEDGTFAFVALPESVIINVARSATPAHFVATKELTIAAEERNEIEIILSDPRETVDVAVVDRSGYPLERAEVRIASLDPTELFQRTVFVDEDGRGTIPGARGLPLRIVTWRKGHSPDVIELDEAPAVIQITLEPERSATGIVESHRSFLADARITMLTPTGAHYAKSNSDGEFTIGGLAPGVVRLLIEADGFVPVQQDAIVDEDDQRASDLGRIKLQAAGQLSGIVVDEEGDPVVNARVASGRVPTYLPMGALPVGIAVTDRKGRFLLTGLPAGDHEVEAYRRGFVRDAARAVVRAGDTTTGIRITVERDPDVDLTAVNTEASLAVTLGEHQVGGGTIVRFEHVPIGGEAQRAGIMAGDRFMAYNGRPIRSLEQARRALNGPLSQQFVLQLERPPQLRWRVRVRREKVRQ